MAWVSEADVELIERDLILEFRGTKVARRRAKRLARFILEQRRGKVHLREEFGEVPPV